MKASRLWLIASLPPLTHRYGAPLTYLPPWAFPPMNWQRLEAPPCLHFDSGHRRLSTVIDARRSRRWRRPMLEPARDRAGAA